MYQGAFCRFPKEDKWLKPNLTKTPSRTVSSTNGTNQLARIYKIYKNVCMTEKLDITNHYSVQEHKCHHVLSIFIFEDRQVMLVHPPYIRMALDSGESVQANSCGKAF